MSRGDEAFGVANNALGVGNDAKQMALIAQQKADQANADADQLRHRVAYLESKHKIRHRTHHRAAPQPQDQVPSQ
jgi:hypothetical protein